MWKLLYLRHMPGYFYRLCILLMFVSNPASPELKRTTTSIISERRVMRMEIGDHVVFPCKVRNLGTTVIIWKHGNRVLTAGSLVIKKDDRLTLDNTNLALKNLTRDDAGIYTCEVETDIENPLVLHHTLQILEAPVIKPSTREGEIKAAKGSTVRVKCSASGFPPPQISWKRKMGQISASSLSKDSSELFIQNISRHDAGEYICVAQNGVGTPAIKTVRILVNYAPEVEAERPRLHSGPGFPLDLSCIVYARPEASISWYRNTMLLEPDNNLFFHSKGTLHTMSIRTLTSSQLGNYTCSAVNIFGKGEATILVTGRPEAPVWEDPDSVLSESVELSWSTYSHSPILKYRLQYRKLQEETNSDHFHAWISLMILPDHNASSEVLYDFTYNVDKLSPETRYEAISQSYNKFGWSEPSTLYNFSTSVPAPVPKLLPQIPKNSIDPNPQLILSNASKTISTSTYAMLLLTQMFAVLVRVYQ